MNLPAFEHIRRQALELSRLIEENVLELDRQLDKELEKYQPPNPVPAQAGLRDQATEQMIRDLSEQRESLRRMINRLQRRLEEEQKKVAQVTAEKDNWMETAAQATNSSEYYHGLLVDIGNLFGKDARTSLDGAIGTDVLVTKVAQLVAETKTELADLQRLFTLQQQRMDEATKLWHDATGRYNVLPDLGNLLDWLMERGHVANRELLQAQKALEEAQHTRDLAQAQSTADLEAKRAAEAKFKDLESRVVVLEATRDTAREARDDAQRALRELTAKLRRYDVVVSEVRASITEMLKDEPE